MQYFVCTNAFCCRFLHLFLFCRWHNNKYSLELQSWLHPSPSTTRHNTTRAKCTSSLPGNCETCPFTAQLCHSLIYFHASFLSWKRSAEPDLHTRATLRPSQETRPCLIICISTVIKFRQFHNLSCHPVVNSSEDTHLDRTTNIQGVKKKRRKKESILTLIFVLWSHTWKALCSAWTLVPDFKQFPEELLEIWGSQSWLLVEWNDASG